MPLLMNEDGALKQKLEGLSVHDATTGPQGRTVTVRFKNPEYELADAGFPLILISHAGISRAQERESRGYVRLGYAPEGYAPWADINDPSQSPYSAQTPIPLNLDYQIEVYARKQAHMTELLGQLLQFDCLPPRFGYLSVPQDGTTRRLDILGGPESTESKDELGKRLFVAAWSVRVSAEIFLSEVDQLPPVQRVLLGLVDAGAYRDGQVVPLDPVIVSAPAMLTPAANALPPGIVGVPYLYSLAATGGIAPYNWTLRSGALPAGLAVSETGVVFGTPSVTTPTPPPSFSLGLSDSDTPPQVTQQTLALAISGS
ncbi:putative Ig domain-containing protein [Kitasatospora sp. NPDC052896]|uniref:putative Ig domain-containing protein n=1 Tax=Kitasatospora sp. NPDC052896 TaxID=3364061 RepID=UPI0037CAFE64